MSNYKHGMKHTRTYRIWTNMKTRCGNPKSPNYERYGAIGISVCKRWELFKNFLEDMGECPDGLTLERKNNLKGYSKSNCKWATVSEQNRNTKRRVFVKFKGEIIGLRELVEKQGCRSLNDTKNRLREGWSLEDALFKKPIWQKSDKNNE